MVSKLSQLYSSQSIYVKLYVATRSKFLKMDYYLHFLPSYGLIIDIGCGYGVLANYIKLSLPNCHVVGIDTDSKRIDIAKSTIGKRDSIDFACRDATELEFPSCSSIIMTDFLHHTHKQKEVIINSYKSLKEGGYLIIEEVDPSSNPILKYWISSLSDRILYPHSKSYFRTPEYWVNMLSRIGFIVETIIPPSIVARIIYICRKV